MHIPTLRSVATQRLWHKNLCPSTALDTRPWSDATIKFDEYFSLKEIVHWNQFLSYFFVKRYCLDQKKWQAGFLKILTKSTKTQKM